MKCLIIKNRTNGYAALPKVKRRLNLFKQMEQKTFNIILMYTDDPLKDNVLEIDELIEALQKWKKEGYTSVHLSVIAAGCDGDAELFLT